MSDTTNLEPGDGIDRTPELGAEEVQVETEVSIQYLCLLQLLTFCLDLNFNRDSNHAFSPYAIDHVGTPPQEIESQVLTGSWANHNHWDDLRCVPEAVQNNYLHEEDLKAFQQPVYDFAAAPYHL